MDNLKFSDYLKYFKKDKDSLYIRTDFKSRLGELKGFSLRQLLDLITDNPTDKPHDYLKKLRAFESGKPLRVNHSNYQKQNIPYDIRWAVWERDNFTCQDCGSRKFLSVDHIVPEARGGGLEMENLQTLCKTCNSRKGTR